MIGLVRILGLFAVLLVEFDVSLARAHLDELPSVGSEIDLQFQCNDDVSEGSMKNAPLIIELGRALSSADLKSSMFLLSVYTAGHNNPEEDLLLSERCANLVRKVLIDQFGLQPVALSAVGYGGTQLKNPTDPAATENQRLNVRNLGVRPMK